MKKFLLMLGAVALFTACEKGSSGAVNYEEGFKYLTSLNVKDAKMVYQKKSSTRAAGDNTYWKLDLSGNESKLVIKGEDGQSHDIGIDRILKLSDRILLMQPSVDDVMSLLPKPDGDGLHTAISNDAFLSLVDVQTEKIYKWPKELFLNWYDGELKTETDIRGNVYFVPNPYQTSSQIYKLDVSNFTIQPVLPDGQSFYAFRVTNDGFIIYWNRNESKVKCPGGRIQPIIGPGFIINNKLYSADNENIYYWEIVGNNELNKKDICSFQHNVYSVLINSVRQTAVLCSDKVFEFDGQNNPEEIEINGEFYNMAGGYITSKAWYIKENNMLLHKLDMQTYQYKKVTSSDCEIFNLYADVNKPDMTFTGFRYIDGANVVGKITSSDELVIEDVADNGSKIINLISLI